MENFFDSLPQTSQTILADKETIGIIRFMLQIVPANRPSCQQILQHEFFADLDNDYKLIIEGVTKQVIDVDSNPKQREKPELTYLEPEKR